MVREAIAYRLYVLNVANEKKSSKQCPSYYLIPDNAC